MAMDTCCNILEWTVKYWTVLDHEVTFHCVKDEFDYNNSSNNTYNRLGEFVPTKKWEM